MHCLKKNPHLNFLNNLWAGKATYENKKSDFIDSGTVVNLTMVLTIFATLATNALSDFKKF